MFAFARAQRVCLIIARILRLCDSSLRRAADFNGIGRDFAYAAFGQNAAQAQLLWRAAPKKSKVKPDGPVAQGIEQQPSKLKVAGSNPAGVANESTT
jgi:hypothetical protein